MRRGRLSRLQAWEAARASDIARRKRKQIPRFARNDRIFGFECEHSKSCGFGKIVGIFVVGVGGGIVGVLCGHDRGDAAHLVAEGAGGEAGFFEEAGEEMFAGGLVVDVADEEAGAAALAADGEFGEFFCQLAGELGAFGFVFGEEDLDGGVAAAKECGEDAVDEDYAGTFCTGHGVGSAG